MRKRLFITLLAVFTTFVAFSQTDSCTVIVTDEQAYLEDFSSTTLNSCWTLTTDYSYPTYGNWQIYSTALYHEYSTGTTADAITPTLDITNVTTPWVKFDHYQPDYGNSGVCNHLTVLYRTSPEGAWSVLLEFTDVISSYQTDSIALPNASATYQLCFRWSNPSSSADGIFIDNLTVYNEENPPACVKATEVSISNILFDEATISWNQTDDNNSWIVYYKAEDSTTWNSEEVTSDPSITLYNLTAKTTYEVYIATVCGDNEESYPKTNTYTFKTACDVEGLTLPYYDGFESDNPLECYTKAASVDVTGYWGGNFPKEITGYTTVTNNNSQTSIEFKNANLVLVLPPFANDVDLSTARAKVYVQKNSVSDYITMEVGVMTDATDTSTFESMGVLTAGSNVMEENIVSFANLTNEGKYVAFYFKNNIGNGSYYIDDVTIEVIPACAKIDGKLSLVTSDNESATINFSDAEDQSSWKLFYKKANESDDNYTSIDLSDTTYTIDNLEASTKYTAYVIRICNEGDDMAERSNYLTFSTTAVPYDLTTNEDIYTMDFEDTDSMTGWSLTSNYTNKWIYGSAVNNGGEKSLYISNDDSSFAYTTTSTSYAYASFLVKFGNKAEYTLSFDYKCNGEKTYSTAYDYLSVYLCDGSYELPTSDNPTGTVLLSQIASVTDWTNFNTILEGVQGTTKQLVFYFRTDNYSGTGEPAAIDNVSIIGSDCGSANTLTTSNITEDSATITWVQPGEETVSWKVEYRVYGQDTWQETSQTSTASIDLSGLNASTMYEYRVITICGDNPESYPISSTSTFRTTCGVISLSSYDDGIWKQDFENLSSSSLEDLCFTLTKTATASNGTFPYIQDLIGQGSAHTGTDDGSYGPGHALECKGGDIILTLPRFNEDINSLRFKFWYRQNGTTSTSGSCEIGVMSDPNDESTFESISTLTVYPVSSTVNYYNYYLASVDFSTTSYSSNEYYIAINYTSANAGISWYWDDIEVSLAPSCSGIDLNSVSVNNIGAHTADVTFSDPDPSHDTWDIYAKTDTTDWEVIATATDTTYQLTDLTPSTTYYIYVVTVCNNEESVDKSMVVSFTTDEACPAPTNLTIDNIAETSANISWSSSSEVSSWVVSYKENTDDTTWIDLTAEETNIDITNLTANTTYIVKVKGDCGEEGNSTEIQTTFTTACEAIVVEDNTPWEEDFSTSNALDCWYITGGWYINNGLLYHSYYYATEPDNILTPIFDLTNLSSPAIKFSYTLEDFEGSNVVNHLTVSYRANISDDWTELKTYDTLADNLTDIITLPNPSATYQLSFGWSNYDYDANGIKVDDIKIFNNEANPCEAPTSLTATNIAQTTATISWSGTASSYEMQLNDDTIETTTSTSKELTNLTANTTYTVKVRSICDTTTSDWVTTSFTTLESTSNPCEAPTSLTTNNITQTTATISWEGTASSYDLQLNDNAIETTNTTSKQFTGLTANTTYTVKVRSNCGTTTSDWVTTTFTTLENASNPCNKPTNLEVVPTSNSLTLSWTGDATAYDVQIDNETPQTTQQTTFTFTNLTHSTTYSLKVRSNCGDEVSDWATITTTTLVDSSSLINIENSVNILTYPNPTTTNATLEINGLTEDANIILTDVNGRVVFKDIYSVNQSSITIRTESLPAGVYYIRVMNNSITKTLTLIKE